MLINTSVGRHLVRSDPASMSGIGISSDNACVGTGLPSAPFIRLGAGDVPVQFILKEVSEMEMHSNELKSVDAIKTV